MAGSELIIAAMLLTIPPGVPATCPPEADFPALRDAIHQVAVRWEILDERESRYVLTRPADFCTDLNMLRRRYRDLDGAPLVADSARFPERHYLNEQVKFNRVFRRHVDERRQLEVDRAESLRDVVMETDRLYQIWDSVRDARCDFYYVTVRRQALKKLRDMIGEDAYESAKLPANVPTWRFNEMK